MEIYQLKSLLILAEEGSLRPAAERLFVSQPTLSGHIKALEEELGIRLFDRTRNGMLLTEAGEAIHKHAEQIVSLQQDAFRIAKDIRNDVSGVLRLGIINDGINLRLSEIATLLNERAPGISLQIISSNTGSVLRALERQELDVGFAESEELPVGLSGIPVSWGKPVIVIPKKWEASVGTKSWEQLAASPWAFVSKDCSYYKSVEKEAGVAGVEIAWKYQTDHSLTALSLAEKGLAIAVVDENSAAESMKRGLVAKWPSFGPTVPIRMALLTKRHREKPLHTFSMAVADSFELKLSDHPPFLPPRS